jgi:serine/threonine protein kinase/tetratricopeptide (TPR) repeat protein
VANDASQATSLQDSLQSALSGTYTLERELGGGGMSRVFVAEERALARRVVVKVLSPDLAAGVSAERFKREILLTARLQHPHIVPVLSAGETNGLPFYTMPFVEGESLRVRLVRTGAMPVGDVVRIIRDVARALDFAHERGVVHRDIKPENILLAGESATVSDFGISKALDAARSPGQTQNLTEVGFAVGTPQYMAPEQIAADPDVDNRADLYSLGCVAYELLVGEPPFAGLGPTELLRAHLIQNPPLVGDRRGDVPEVLSNLIARCLAKDPANRPPNARDLLAVLDGATTPSGGHLTTSAFVAEVKTVAVLPFANLSADQESEHFADGLTDEIITDLSMLKTLRVISRQSAMRLKGTAKDVRTIARELGTRYVLTGGIRTSGPNIRVTAQLLDATDDAPLWADKYTGTLDDVFDIQEKLSRQIVDALRVRLTPDEDRRIAARPIADMRAYEFYLLARQEIWSFTAPSLERALHLIRRAQDIVGESELLLAAEGMIYWQHVNVGLVPVDRYDEYLGKAEACAERLFELNPQSSKAYALRGAVRNNRADPAGSMADFKKALVFDHNDPESLLWLGYHYAVAGRVSLARGLMDRLQQVDPLTSMNLGMCAIVAMCDGEYGEALSWTRRSVEIDPANPTLRMLHAQALAANERRAEAIAILHDVASDAASMTWARLAAALAFALEGNREQVVSVVTADIRDAAERDDIFSWWMADSFALVGETKAALDSVERMIALGIINYPFLSEYEPFLSSIRSEPRFGQLMDLARERWNAFEP